VLVALSGEGARGQDLVGERDEEDAGRRRNERDDVLQRRGWNVDARQPCRNRADDRHAVRLQIERPREPDRGDDDDERRRQPWHDVAEGEENPQRDRGHRERHAADAAQLAHHFPELRQRVRQPEELSELADDQDDRDPVDVAE
jgi:hypothetical protein